MGRPLPLLHEDASPAPDTLRIAQVVPSTEAEGPGKRFALWVQGCAILCPGCCNPEMLPFEGGRLERVDALAERILATPGIEGVSLLGGEPVAQARALVPLAERVRAAGLSVMVYTGYTREELAAMKRPEVDALLAQVDLLVDGRYERAQPEEGEGARRWIGSANQGLHFLTDRYRPEDPQFRGANTVEIRMIDGQLVVNGWPGLAKKFLKGVRPVGPSSRRPDEP